MEKKKPTVKMFKSEFQNTIKEKKNCPLSNHKLKVQSEKSTKRLSTIPPSTFKKRSLSPQLEPQSEKKLKSSPSDVTKLASKIYLCFIYHCFSFFIVYKNITNHDLKDTFFTLC